MGVPPMSAVRRRVSMSPTVPSTFVSNGFGIVDSVLSADQVALLRSAAERVAQKRDPAPGIRDIVRIDQVFEVAVEAAQPIARAILGDAAMLVRSILFDKTPAANWDVVWHQDVTIAVAEKTETPGFGPWSRKLGVWHVQPPFEVLSNMVTVRIHLDDCDVSNGALLVVPRSHDSVVDVRTLDRTEAERRAVACEVHAGGAVVMRPLILHASRKSVSPSHRRVIHLEFAGAQLPAGLRWNAHPPIARTIESRSSAT